MEMQRPITIRNPIFEEYLALLETFASLVIFLIEFSAEKLQAAIDFYTF
jgi:hypothetical protein